MDERFLGGIGIGLVAAGAIFFLGFQAGQEYPETFSSGVYKSGRAHSTPSQTPTPLPTNSGEPVPNEPKPDVKFGETYVFGPEGLAFSVSKPKPVNVAHSKGQKADKFIEFSVKMTNTGNYEWKIEHTLLSISADKGGIQYSGSDPRSLAPGKSVTTKYIFGVADIPNHTVSVEIMPDFVSPVTWG